MRPHGFLRVSHNLPLPRIVYAMRVIFYSFRTIWADFSRAFRRSRKIWLLALSFVLLGVAVGVVTALLVEEPTPTCVLGSVLAHTYRPFAVFGRLVACLALGVVVVYVSARFTRRFPFWAYLAFVGYVLGRVLAFAGMAGALGVGSVFLCEFPFCLLSLVFVVAYYCDLCGVVLYTLDPRRNRPFVHSALRFLLVGTVCLFALVVVVWGLFSLLVNVVV